MLEGTSTASKPIPVLLAEDSGPCVGTFNLEISSILVLPYRTAVHASLRWQEIAWV